MKKVPFLGFKKSYEIYDLISSATLWHSRSRNAVECFYLHEGITNFYYTSQLPENYFKQTFAEINFFFLNQCYWKLRVE